MTSTPAQMLGPGMSDTTPDGEPKCENCSRAARYIWTLDSGQEAQSCEGCRPASGVTRRELGVPAAKGERVPLTVEQAAVRESVSERTVYRWTASGVLGDGAWKVGAGEPGSGEWRIDPDALDSRRSAPRPKAEPKRPRRRRAATAKTDAGWFTP
jgi:excisionase family DNA binding protein